jgi:hypothetical protein
LEKYAPVYYSRASVVVREWYQTGRRWVYITMPPPISPASSLTAPGLIPSWSARLCDLNSSPNSVTNSSCASSEAGDDMPRTPITPGYGMTDPFIDANIMAVATAAGISVPHIGMPVMAGDHHHHHHQKENMVPKAYHARMATHHKSVMVPQVNPHVQSVSTQYAVPMQRHALHPVQPTAASIPKALRRLSG